MSNGAGWPTGYDGGTCTVTGRSPPTTRPAGDPALEVGITEGIVDGAALEADAPGDGSADRAAEPVHAPARRAVTAVTSSSWCRVIDRMMDHERCETKRSSARDAL
jgi:hypothetical protein